MLKIAKNVVTRLAQVRQPLRELLKQQTRSYGEFNVNIPLAAPTTDLNMGIPFKGDKILVTYIWIDGTGENMREKTRTLDKDPGAPENYPRWSFDGSSTYQAFKGEDSDMILKPAAVYPDPFFGGNHKLLLCEVLDAHEKPSSKADF
ncbi:glutamine synthetase, beta-grasp domain protein [Necator americanus]|uniref:Glutamine synthetase, beta-grasp domain protein n=1 Tax=Necator americanus TaxID=51031 RepID=W2TGA9_NECAM|nr:glutamine synthetase, beta-grasp domain protein [Necator americanus]ETN80052.1 glutamine synthetase, beta-grasp domain protein [Necator americanus]